MDFQERVLKDVWEGICGRGCPNPLNASRRMPEIGSFTFEYKYHSNAIGKRPYIHAYMLRNQFRGANIEIMIWVNDDKIKTKCVGYEEESECIYDLADPDTLSKKWILKVLNDAVVNLANKIAERWKDISEIISDKGMPYINIKSLLPKVESSVIPYDFYH
jgi:hypothetical protein